MNSSPKIYTVTTLYLDPENLPGKFQKDYRVRTWGFYFSLKEAIAGMKRSCSDEGGYYNYCIIEKFSPGIYAIANFEKWFVWKDNKWVCCSKPESEKVVINYAIG